MPGCILQVNYYVEPSFGETFYNSCKVSTLILMSALIIDSGLHGGVGRPRGPEITFVGGLCLSGMLVCCVR